MRVGYRPAMTLACLVARYAPAELWRIPQQWMQFGARVSEASGWRGPATFGVWSAWRDGAVDYACAMEMTPGQPVPAGWTPLVLPTARYAILEHGGSIRELHWLVPWVVKDWSPPPGCARRRDLGGDVALVERYGPRFDRRAASGDIELWLPLEG